jgi:hypothetical protein
MTPITKFVFAEAAKLEITVSRADDRAARNYGDTQSLRRTPN